jgi:hypothetical protein
MTKAWEKEDVKQRGIGKGWENEPRQSSGSMGKGNPSIISG